MHPDSVLRATRSSSIPIMAGWARRAALEEAAAKAKASSRHIMHIMHMHMSGVKGGQGLGVGQREQTGSYAGGL